jgi:PAS domain S-box-containing protein
MRLTSPKLLLAGIIIVIISIAIVTFFSIRVAREVEITNNEVTLTQKIILQNEKIQSAIIYYESNIKSYLLSPNEEIVSLLSAVEENINSQLNDLRVLVSPEAFQVTKVDSLRYFIQQRLNYSKQTILLRNEKGLTASIQFINSPEIAEYIRKTRSLFQEIRTNEGKVMEQRGTAERNAITRFNIVLVFLFIVLMLLISIAFLQYSHNKIEKNKAEEDARYLEMLLNNVAEAIISTDADFKVLSWNKVAERIYGFETGKTNGMDVSLAVKSQLTDEEKMQVRKAMIENKRWEGETTHMNAEGREITILSLTSALYDNKNQLTGFVSSNLDITDRKKANQLLIQFNEELTRQVKIKTDELTNIFERVTDAFVALDKNWNFVYVNKKAGEIVGRNPVSLIGKHIWAEFPEAVGHPLYNAYNLAMKEQHLVQIEEHYALNDRWFLNLIYPSADGLSIYLQDVTDRKKAEELLNQSYKEIKELSAHLVDVREDERIAIARELHDELGQQLTALKMDISWLGKKINETDEDLKNKIKEINSLIDHSVNTIRRISSELRPSILDDLGIVAAMEWQIQEYQKKSGIIVQFNVSGNADEVKGNIATGLYRILQEALTNTLRHAKAKKISVKLEQNSDKINLTIEDDGIGFNANEIKLNKTLGLLGMKERILMMEGEFKIRSKEREGTTIHASIPHKANKEEILN